MSAFQRFMTWLRGGMDEEVEKALFESLPVELYGEIFKHLNVQNLNICKEVCRTWDNGLSASRELLKKSITTWSEINLVSSDDIFQQIGENRVQILTVEFRLKNFNDFSFITRLLPCFTALDGFQFVTHFEIDFSWTCVSCVTFIVSQLKALVSLTLSDIQLVNSDPESYPNDEVIPDTIWPDLKILKITIPNIIYNHLHYENLSASIFPNYCTGLKRLSVQELYHCDVWFDNVERRDEHREFRRRFIHFAKTMRKNSRTLKSAELDTFRFDISREKALSLVSDDTEYTQEQVRDGQDEVFVRFMGQLREYTDWESSGLRLNNLNLSFQLVRLELPQAREVFFPFLRTQTDLMEFSLSNVYFPGGGQKTIRELLDCLPQHCCTKLEGVMTVRIQNPAGNNLQPYFDSPIQGYFDSFVELTKANFSLTLRFVCCNSLREIDFFPRNIRSLTKIKIQQSGARLQYKIALEDEDIQLIIKNAIHLTDLWLEFCNLEAITDSGLTGIDPGACERMSLAGNFKLQDGDMIIGSPISAIQKLRSLSLSTVGGHVTDVTACHAFKGLNSLSCFGISKPKMTSIGYRELRRLFQFNQVVQFDPHTKFQFDCLDFADSEDKSSISSGHWRLD